MHIPDNYLSPATCAVMTAAMIPVWALSVKKVKGEIEKANLPLLGIGAAFSFLFMMFNIPLPGGTTGHAVGATLIAALLGPWAACISVSVALLIQALLFGDGGILAFGANCFNMAFVIPFLGYFAYKFIAGRIKGARAELIGLGIASYLALNVGALCAAIEFGLQPLLARGADGAPLYCPYPLSVSIPAMAIPHLLVAGLVEAFFTVGVFAFIRKVSPGIIAKESRPKIKAIYGLVVGLICLSPLGLLAAGTAWGEWGADEIQEVVTGGRALGFVPAGMEKGFSFNAVFPDYSVSGLPEWVGYVISALAGAAILVILFRLLALLKKGKPARA
jgi:cobalt/nickel transport system permease protein